MFPAQGFNKLRVNSPSLCFGLGGEFGHGALFLWIQQFLKDADQEKSISEQKQTISGIANDW